MPAAFRLWKRSNLLQIPIRRPSREGLAATVSAARAACDGRRMVPLDPRARALARVGGAFGRGAPQPLSRRRTLRQPHGSRGTRAALAAGPRHAQAEERAAAAQPLLDLVGVERQRGAAPTKPVPVTLANGRKLAVSLFGAMTLEAADADEKRS